MSSTNMSTLQKSILALVGVAVIVGVYGGYRFLFSSPQVVAIGSPSGSTFSTAKVAQINVSPSTAAATTTSILNTDASDRYVTNGYAACGSVGTSKTFLTGTGLAAWSLQVATTSVANQGLQGSTNYAFQAGMATGTADIFTMGTSTGLTSSYLTRWAAGSYMTFLFNATNTAACTVGVSYIAS